MRGRKKGTTKYKDPLTMEFIGVYQFREIMRAIKKGVSFNYPIIKLKLNKGRPFGSVKRRDKRGRPLRVNEYRKTQEYKTKKYEQEIKNKYNLNYNIYERLLKSQSDLCGICRTPLKVGNRKKIHLDHCHKTNSIRGLLCVKCNLLLGFVNDDINTLQNAIIYLKNSFGSVHEIDRKTP